jgi:hypothetical protein
MLRMACGGGGVQFKVFCTTCWRAGVPIAHDKIERPDAVTEGDWALINAAREAHWRQQREGRL